MVNSNNNMTNLRIYIIACIKSLANKQKNKKYQYYAIRDNGDILELYYSNVLETSNWYNFHNCCIKKTKLYWQPMKISQMLMIENGMHEKVKMTQQTTNKILEPLLREFKKSLKNCIDYNRDMENFQDNRMNTKLVSSLNNVCTSGITSGKKMTVLCNVADHNVYHSQAKVSYCFNINFENRQMSVIKWNHDLDDTDWIQNNINKNTINIFVNVEYKDIGKINNKTPYLMITDNSYIVYNLCGELKQLVQTGSYDIHHIQDVASLWLHTTENNAMNLMDYRLFKNLSYDKYTSYGDAMHHIRKQWDESKMKLVISCIAELNSKKVNGMENLTSNECYIINYCNICRTSERSIEYMCRHCNTEITPWFQADTLLKIKDDNSIYNNAIIKVGIPFKTIRVMYNYCKEFGLTSHDLQNVIAKVENILDDTNYHWTDVEESQLFVPVIEAFYKNMHQNRSLKLAIMITKSKSGARSYTNYKLHAITWTKKQINKKRPRENTNNMQSTDHAESSEPANKKQRTE